MPLAERSDKTAVENQEEVGLMFEIGQADQLTAEVRQGKIGSGHVESYFGHVEPLWLDGG